MVRTFDDPDQILRAYQLWVKRLNAAAISRKLQEEFDNPKDVSTVRRWIRSKFSSMGDKEEANPDAPFEWHRMDEYGLPWEASQSLLTLWSDDRRTAGIVRDYEDIQLTPPTVRRVRWWWRVKQAAPELRDIDIRPIAAAYERRELRGDLAIEKHDFEDLNACLAFKPWSSPQLADAYEDSKAKGLIPKLRPDPMSETVALAIRLTNTGWKPIPGEPWPDDIISLVLTLGPIPWPTPDVTPDWLLPSQQIEQFGEARAKELVQTPRDGEELGDG